MHTNSKNTPAAQPSQQPAAAASADRPAQPKKGRSLKTKTCPGCGVRRATNAFPRLKPGEPFRLKIRCFSCQRHGGVKLRRDHQRRQLLADNPGHKFCRHCGALKPLQHFLLHARSVDGRRGVCQACRKVKRKAERALERAVAEARERGRLRRELRFNIGLAVAYATCPPGFRRTRAEIAHFCCCSEEMIRSIEETAINKVVGPVSQLLQAAGVELREVRL